MKGTVFVGIYSVVLIGLFVVFCYLMTTVNPDPYTAPEEHKSLRKSINGKYISGSQKQKYIIGYGLEKIPEGVDADEFRRTTVTTIDDYDVGRASVEYYQKVVPPVWPDNSYTDNERYATENRKQGVNKLNKYPLHETYSSVKGFRRSVDDNDNMKGKKNPGSILLNIIDKSGRKNIEIKFVSTENLVSKELINTTFKFNATKTFDIFVDSNQSSTTEKPKSNSVVKIKANDIVILTVVDDFDTAIQFGEGVKNEIYTKNVTNIPNTNTSFNKTLNNTNITGIHGREIKLTNAFKDKENHTFNLLSKGNVSV